jgi:ApbE superfamily uncharacterized protein (UPF0280 family)
MLALLYSEILSTFMQQTNLREFKKYSFKGANFRISSDCYSIITREIINQRRILTDYIHRHEEFLSALSPIRLLPDAPEIAIRMHEASLKTGVGPMAAVAGVTAQIAAEAALAAGAEEAIVENGGDIYIASNSDVTIGLYAGDSPLSGKLGFAVTRKEMPLAICSSSGNMGHSLSFGNCDLVSVTSNNAALADAAATLACNLVKTADCITPTMENIVMIPGILGILIINDDKVGVSGKLPKLVQLDDSNFRNKITHDKNARIDYT